MSKAEKRTLRWNCACQLRTRGLAFGIGDFEIVRDGRRARQPYHALTSAGHEMNAGQRSAKRVASRKSELDEQYAPVLRMWLTK